FNYGDVPYLIDFVRKYGIIPFATFPFKAVPFVADVMYHHPHRILRFPRAVEAWNEGVVGSSEDLAREIEALPDHVRDKMVVRMPFKERNGRPLYVDISYFVPFGVMKGILESVTGTGEEGIFTGGLRSGTISPPLLELTEALRLGIDSFGNEITRKDRNTF